MHLSQNLLLMLGGDHSADDVMHGENPVESKVSDGDNKTDVELPYGL
ncbi:BnaCnng26440D [Brassica napus]|uniref:BnaCnng26440D protein n=1 Tax=Brassica napus TaxID=3708 RepID=A0A078IXY3_BRANA|nr:BnaCnng26440D [Brassica napus]